MLPVEASQAHSYVVLSRIVLWQHVGDLVTTWRYYQIKVASGYQDSNSGL